MLETGRLILRQYEETDLTAMTQLLGDAKTMRFWPEPFDRKAATAWLNRAMRSYEAHGFGRWVVVRKQDNLVIGDCGILKVEVNPNVA